MATARHRLAPRHAGHRRPFGSWRSGRHCRRDDAWPSPAPALPAPRVLAELVAAPAPGLDLRPIDARPIGPNPYDANPVTAPLAIISGAAA